MDSSAAWLDLDRVAHVTVTAPGGPRRTSVSRPWTAETPGEHTINVRFHRPTMLRRVRIAFSEPDELRTQEFTICASQHRGERHRELIRQQFTFSPGGATVQVEDYTLEVDDVGGLQVRIVPDISGRPVLARVTELRIAAKCERL